MVGANDYVTKPVKRIEFLARVKAALELKLQYDVRTKYEQAMNQDLELARKIQKSLLPHKLQDNYINVQGYIKESTKLSGDMYYWEAISDYEYGIILIDIMGHGISSSLVGMTIRSLLPGLIRRLKKPEAVFTELNRQMMKLHHQDGDSWNDMGYYFTAIYLLVNRLDKKIRYANAGHPPAYIVTGQANCTPLEVGCLPIGLFSTLQVETGEFFYEQKSRLILYTDGYFETYLNQAEAQEIDFPQWLQRKVNTNSEATFGQLVAPVKNIRQGHEDDISIVLIELK